TSLREHSSRRFQAIPQRPNCAPCRLAWATQFSSARFLAASSLRSSAASPESDRSQTATEARAELTLAPRLPAAMARQADLRTGDAMRMSLTLVGPSLLAWLSHRRAKGCSAGNGERGTAWDRTTWSARYGPARYGPQ